MKSTFFLATLVTLAAPAVAAEGPRHVVLVMTDDQGYGDLHCHGNPLIQTPNLDRLHGEAVRLVDFHVDPTCSPTRAALMTGRYSSRTGVWHTILGRSLLRRDETTLAELFHQAGYQTGIFGKWHLGDNHPFRPQERGFDTTLVHGGGGIGQTPDAWGNTYFDPVLLRDGVPVETQGYCTEVFFDAALKFMEANRNRPFFLYLPTNVAHGPYQVPDSYRALYEAQGAPEPLARFYGMITHFDEQLGRLLRKLRELGLERDTLLIYLTDNGTSGSGFNAGMRGRKGSEYEGGHRVPCFWRWPGHFPGGVDLDVLSAHIDIAPTLIDLCGLSKPALELDGRSLRPLLEDPSRRAAWPSRTLFVQSHRIEHPRPYRKSSVLTDHFRLVNGAELYDLKEDPGQQKNLADARAELASSLRRAYDEWYASVSQRFGEYCEIVLGSDAENPALLTAHDWHGDQVPWNQNHVRQQPPHQGFWAVEFARTGMYRFTLRAQPEAARFELALGEAFLRIGDQILSQEIPGGSRRVVFTTKVTAEKTRLETTLVPAGHPEKQRGAFFLEVEFLGERRPNDAR